MNKAAPNRAIQPGQRKRRKEGNWEKPTEYDEERSWDEIRSHRKCNYYSDFHKPVAVLNRSAKVGTVLNSYHKDRQNQMEHLKEA